MKKLKKLKKLRKLKKWRNEETEEIEKIEKIEEIEIETLDLFSSLPIDELLMLIKQSYKFCNFQFFDSAI